MNMKSEDRRLLVKTLKELWVILGKCLISLPIKVFDFRSLCLLAVATWLLVNGHIRDWIWFAIVVVVLFGIVGLKVLFRWKDIDHE